MKIKWTLRDPRFCQTCPCLEPSDATGKNYCRLGYVLGPQVRYESVQHAVILRPDACRRRNGD